MKPRRFTARVMLFACALWFLIPSAQAFYNPSTGQWLSRDPIEEKGCDNLYAFVSNQPQISCDSLGLADWHYSEGTPTGNWVVRMDDIDHPDHGTLHGFRSVYVPSTDPPCPCKVENIILVQAVRNSIVGTRMDNADAVYKKYQHKKGTAFRDYYDLLPAWVLRLRHSPLELVDAPLRGGTEKDNYTWAFEDCAVCRHTLRDGTVVDRVLGCVRFDFVRSQDGTASLDPGGKVLSGAAKSPSELWSKALKHWKKWTDT